jgi:hypothetical protein
LSKSLAAVVRLPLERTKCIALSVFG